MSTDFREQLYMAHLQIGKPAAAESVQSEADECCSAWGHDYIHSGWSSLPSHARGPETVGGTPIVSNAKCRRCGAERTWDKAKP
jgi:hypothetical protein